MNNQNPFGEIIYAYTRAQAVADGFQVDVTKTAQEAGSQFAKRTAHLGHPSRGRLGKPIKFPMFLTRAVYDHYVAVPQNVTGQDEAGRLWNVVWMTRFAIQRSRGHTERLPVALYVRNDNRAARLVKLVATCGPLDMDDPQPAITLMMPDED
jgi:hypothetical protein